MDMNILTALNDNIRIDREKCTACGRCAEICVLDNLRLQLSPCRQACPLGMNCQGYIRHIARGEAEKGLEKIREAAPLGGVLGRVCSRPCEAACSRIKVDGQAVAIRDLKRYLTDRDEKHWAPPVLEDRPQRIAIVGAGPAGVTAAFHLQSWGFRVALFDKESGPGGLLRWAIPEFRLPGTVLRRELGFLERQGLEFKGGRMLGKDLELGRLEREYDAVLLAVGAHAPARLGVQGEDHPSVLPVLDFMKRVRENRPPEIGRRVVVVGGGNSAVDAAQTALRLGAEQVTLVALEKLEEMPAFPWNVSEAREEGVEIRNDWGPMHFRLAGNGLAGVKVKKCLALCDSRGNFCPSYDEKTTMDLPADTVIVAVGHKIDTEMIPEQLAGPEGVRCHPVTLQIPGRKVFCAGDLLRGPRTIVEAMAHGKEAAISIRRLLEGEDLAYGRDNGNLYELQFEPDCSRAVKRPRVPVSVARRSPTERFGERAARYSPHDAAAEAERCVNCGLPFGLRTCWFCLPCEIECPEKALKVEIPFLLR